MIIPLSSSPNQPLSHDVARWAPPSCASSAPCAWCAPCAVCAWCGCWGDWNVYFWLVVTGTLEFCGVTNLPKCLFYGIQWLVGGLEMDDFSIQLGLQLTKSIIFQRGSYTTNQYFLGINHRSIGVPNFDPYPYDRNPWNSWKFQVFHWWN